MKEFNTYKEIIMAETDKDVVELALESGLFSVKIGCSEFSNIGLDEEDANDHFWGYDDEFFGEVIERYCFELDLMKEALNKYDNESEWIKFLKEEELYKRVLELAGGTFDLDVAIKKLKWEINDSLDNCIILEKALENFDFLEEQYIKKILDTLNIDYQIQEVN